MDWMPESEAAKMVSRKTIVLRRHAKSGKWNIAYTHLNGRNFHYSKKDIEKLFNENSTKTRRQW